MNKEKEVKRICGFYVSSMHFITMMLPYLSKQLEENKNIVTFFQNNLSKEIEKVLTKINISKEKKEKLKSIDWNKKRIIDVNKTIEDCSIIIISGNNEYVEEINKNLEKINKKEKITIINCYEVNEDQYNIKKIVEKYKYLINTKGIRKKEDTFTEKNLQNS